MRRGYGWWFALVVFSTFLGSIAGGIVAGLVYVVGGPPWAIGVAGVLAGIAAQAYMFNRADEDGDFS